MATTFSTAKIKAVRKALLNIELDIINEFQEKHGLEDYSLQELAEYLIDNGDCGLKADITDTLEKEFDKMFGRPLTAADRQMIAAYLDFIKPEEK